MPTTPRTHNLQTCNTSPRT